MIRRVVLNNWKSHLRSEFEFSPGVNAMVGIMGSGKTSVLQAISFALYGTIPAIQSRRISLDDMIMKRPQRKEKAEVEVEFIAGRNVYSVKREIRLGKGTTHAEIRENGRLLDVNPKGVTSEVERILEMDYDLFTKAVYSEQNAIDFFLRIPRGQRMELIDRMLRLDRFDFVRAESVSLSNRIAGSVTERARVLDTMKRDGIEDEIGGIEKEIKGIEKEREENESMVKRLSGQISSLREELEGLEDKVDALNQKKQELEGARASLEGLEESIGKRKGAEGKELEKSLKDKRKEVSFLEKGMKEERENLREARERVASLNTEIRIIRESVEELRKIDAKCPLCESEISPEHKRKIEVKRLSDEGKLRGDVKKLAEKASDSSRIADEHEERLREALREMERLEAMEEGIRELEDLRKRRDSLKERRKELEKEIKSLGRVDRKLISGKRDKHEALISRQSEARARMESLEERVSDRREMLRELRERLSLMDSYRREIERDRGIRESLERFTEVLKATQEQLREEFLKTVNNAMSVIWEQLYPYEDFTDIRLTIDKDYVLQLRDSTGWVSVDGIASGGERSIAALALRVAFSMAFIPKLRWLIIDEPTHNLDSNAIDHLSEVLKERIGSFADQVFLITHEDKLSEGISGALYRLERDKSRNGPTIIEKPG
jgi:exonuclease SbcC